MDTSLTAAKCARYVMAQMNDQMPRTYRRQLHPRQDLDAIVESSRPAVRIAASRRSRDFTWPSRRNVAGLIEDGLVLQTGIGGIPDAVLPFLKDRKDLAVHSETGLGWRDPLDRSRA